MSQLEKLLVIHYNYNAEEDKSVCIHCNKKYTGKRSSNMKRHIVSKHPNHAQESGIISNESVQEKRQASIENDNENKAKKIRKLTSEEFVQSCVELATVHLLPFQFFSFPSFRRLINEQESRHSITINQHNIREYVKLSAENIRNIIKQETKNKMIALKVDIASRLGRSILGINAQYFSYLQNKVVIRTLSMVEMKRKHTAQNISLIISSVLNEYDIDKRNISSFTCDNGSNVVAAGKLLQDHQNSMLLNDELESLRSSIGEEYDSESDDEDEDDFDTNGPLDLPCNIKEALSDITSLVVVVRCSIHTLQLAVHDSLKQIGNEYADLIRKIKTITKNLKSSAYVEYISSLGIKIPSTDVVTRWNSTYLTINKLISIKNQLQMLFEKVSEKELESIELNNLDWELMEKIQAAFYPCYLLTMKLQETSNGMGEFYFLWKKCLYELRENGKGCELSKLIYEKMDARTNMLLDGNDILLACLYFDPRYNYEGKRWNDELKARAEAYILKIYKRIESFEKKQNDDNVNQIFTPQEATNFDLFLDEDDELFVPTSENNDVKILDKIRKCCQQRRILASTENFDTFRYFQVKYSDDKTLLETILTLASAPNNQASVERAFSALRILLSHLRYKLSSESIGNILICHLNPTLLRKVEYQLMEI